MGKEGKEKERNSYLLGPGHPQQGVNNVFKIKIDSWALPTSQGGWAYPRDNAYESALKPSKALNAMFLVWPEQSLGQGGISGEGE